MNFANDDEIKFRLNILGMNENYLDADLFVIKIDRLKKIFSESALTKLENGPSKMPKNNSSHQIGRSSFNLETEDREEKFVSQTDIYSEVERDDILADDKHQFENNYYEYNKNTNQYERVVAQVPNEKSYKILSDFKSEQLDKLQKIISEMNATNKEKICVKAYKSKMKSKFRNLYEQNSRIAAEKIKYKIFHKCKFPNCSRTFASSGWLKSHFEEHLGKIKDNKFSMEFEKRLKLYGK